MLLVFTAPDSDPVFFYAGTVHYKPLSRDALAKAKISENLKFSSTHFTFTYSLNFDAFFNKIISRGRIDVRIYSFGFRVGVFGFQPKSRFTKISTVFRYGRGAHFSPVLDICVKISFSAKG